MNTALFERDRNSIYNTYKRLNIAIERAEGCRIYDTEGNSYLDFLGGIAVNTLGHSHPRIVEAVCEQAKKYMHVSNFFFQEPQVRIAEKLLEVSGYCKVFFTNSGSESTESAMKLARKWGSTRGKNDLIGFQNGFHGRTLGALSLMSKPLYRDGMGPFLPNTYVLPFNDPEALRSAVDEGTAAVMLEFIQAEGGVMPATEEFIATMKELKDQFGFLIIADEVQAGVGRTGKFFGFEHYGIQPDIVCMAKGVGGGMPLGAILVHESLCDVWTAGMHGTTYGGNPVACAAGLVVLEEVQARYQENALKMGTYLRAKLEELQVKYSDEIKEIRGKGLLLGLQLGYEAQHLLEALVKRNVIANATAITVLRLVPPLIITESEVDEFVSALDGALEECRDKKLVAAG